MKLLTLNCHSWQEENQLDKISCLASVIKEKDYDVIALQEVSQHMEAPYVNKHIKSDNYGYVLLQELKKLGVHDYELVWDMAHIGYEVYEEGLAILTKHPVVEEHSFFISRTSDVNDWKTRRVVGATISYNDELLSFYSCHLGWWEDDKEPFKDQFDSLWTSIKKDHPFFLLGDFNNNAFIRNEGYDYMKKHPLYDTYDLALEKDEGITVQGKIAGWDENKEKLRIDLILTSDPYKIAKSHVIFNGTNKPVVSDHFGVEVALT
ncbi:endonuclease/exonuclease/phosphatase family protein [Priestia flexa]|uniref:Endonuclease/exonuclease/phosphatase family protein n=1 Tax=Priestia flexa TaxID=86664 RepID=A0ABU4JAE6_9BACI|nr:endonuclease/exonuclease/phosphatase family protein [Priestia flexa]AQX53117.1 endonuclease [Priestia flexa]MBY6086790.1 endonuclease/exonuclease/phosphatase family protein [Priestia flexa]MCA1204139.1 endonuclease/exonuclease/phosphatase family protein [Priestia flexa]MCG7313612.1 endonuclease/exonuclease/phosphatase family protein [Priestia flexa]MCM3065448.1 endonuclease/exonuclease/phosphatase family protein [Priestia flexa]